MSHTCTCGEQFYTDPNFIFRNPDIVYDERAAYVESVCAALIDSRSEPGGSKQMVSDLGNFSDRIYPFAYERTFDAPVIWFLSPPDAGVAQRYIAAAVRRQCGPSEPLRVTIRHPNVLPSHIGRGPPCFQGRELFPVSRRTKANPRDIQKHRPTRRPSG